MIPMLLFCPACNEQHVDRGERSTKPHRTHLCERCGGLFKPANICTVGVESLEDEPESAPDFVIDVPAHVMSLPAARVFWSEALRLPIAVPDEDDLGRYSVLSDRSGVHVEIQMVQGVAGVHLDLQAKDIELEVRRLKRLGAVECPSPGWVDWVIMQAPTGHRFCVIPRR